MDGEPIEHANLPAVGVFKTEAEHFGVPVVFAEGIAEGRVTDLDVLVKPVGLSVLVGVGQEPFVQNDPPRCQVAMRLLNGHVYSVDHGVVSLPGETPNRGIVKDVMGMPSRASMSMGGAQDNIADGIEISQVVVGLKSVVDALRDGTKDLSGIHHDEGHAFVGGLASGDDEGACPLAVVDASRFLVPFGIAHHASVRSGTGDIVHPPAHEVGIEAEVRGIEKVVFEIRSPGDRGNLAGIITVEGIQWRVIHLIKVIHAIVVEIGGILIADA